MRRYLMFLRRPGNRAGVELWIGPLGLAATWPARAAVSWRWGWWLPSA